MEIELQQSSLERLPKYLDLYRACFPKAENLQENYLNWLYRDNPEGHAFGADALYGEEVVGQVIAIPGQFKLRNKPAKGLVAVNVAVHPSFQGRYLFKRLGLQLCEYGAQQGFEFVIGIANAAATPGWVRQMGFQLVRPLEARIGVGEIKLKNNKALSNEVELIHAWDAEALAWRATNPINKISFRSDRHANVITAYASAGKLGISAVAEIPIQHESICLPKANILQTCGPKVFLGLIPGYRFGVNYPNIPSHLKPSPLNFIYKNLNDKNDRLDPSSCFINFLDFDAF